MKNQRTTTEMIDTYLNSVNIEQTRRMVDDELKNLNASKKEFTDSLTCDEETKERAKPSGIDGFIEKPFKVEEFQQIINNAQRK